MDRNYKKGFTLIELLVVIAIIGILSAVVLASLNTARQRGADAAIRSNLSNIRAQAALYYEDNNSFVGDSGDVCDDPIVAGMVEEAGNRGRGTVVCDATAESWVAYVQLQSSDDYFCADWEGRAQDQGSAGNATTAPYACE